MRNPRIVKLMMFAACLSEYEALACINDYRHGLEYSSEAVAHYGGSSAVVFRAVELRANYGLRDMLRQTNYTPR